MMRREIELFFTALMFFTRIPCPPGIDHSEERLQRSRKYFPLIGIVVGGIGAGVYVAAQYAFTPVVAVLLSIIATVWSTGAFHEDGFADVCDGFGGGYTPERIITIMKDSRLGTYGVAGLGLLLALKVALLVQLASHGMWTVVGALMIAHAWSRFVASTFVHTHRYVQDADVSKSKPMANTKLSVGEMLFSAVLALLPLLAFHPWAALVALPVAYLSKLYLARIFVRGIGGYTGDCLGATQQVSEVVMYLTLAGTWNYL